MEHALSKIYSKVLTMTLSDEYVVSNASDENFLRKIECDLRASGFHIPVFQGLVEWVHSTFNNSLIKNLRYDEAFEQAIDDLLEGTPEIYCLVDEDVIAHSCIGRQITDVLLSALRALGIREIPKIESFSTQIFWTILSSMGLWVDVMKYQKDYLFTKYSPQIITEWPDRPLKYPLGLKDGTIMSNGLMRWLKFRLNPKGQDKSVKPWIFLNTILHGIKKGMPQVPASVIEKSMNKHATTLSKVERTEQRFLDEIKRTVREIVKQPICGKALPINENYSLSGSSCVGSTRSNGGALGLLINSLTVSERIGEYELVGCLHRGPTHYEFLYKPAWDVYSHLDDYILGAGLEESWNVPQAYVKFILEPLKVRSISCGDPVAYSMCKPIQKWLWSKLKAFKCFALTNEVVGRAIVNTVVHSMKVGEGVVSGDYSAATDNLHLDCTMAALEATCDDRTESSIKNVMMRALGPHRISYKGDNPKWICSTLLGPKGSKAEFPDEFLQTNGQLMGSPLSFPYLCMINVAVLRTTLEEFYKRSFSIEELNALVNGDDILFTGPRALYLLWRSNIQKVGFIPSPGKNYYSRDFCVVNSTMFKIGSGVNESIPDFPEQFYFCDEAIPYVNMGLITGQTKGDGKGTSVDLNDTIDYSSGFKPFTADTSFEDLMVMLYCGRKSQEDTIYGFKSEKIKNSILEEWRKWRSGVFKLTPFISEGVDGFNLLNPHPRNPKFGRIGQVMVRTLMSLGSTVCPPEALGLLPFYKGMMPKVDDRDIEFALRKCRWDFKRGCHQGAARLVKTKVTKQSSRIDLVLRRGSWRDWESLMGLQVMSRDLNKRIFDSSRDKIHYMDTIYEKSEDYETLFSPLVDLMCSGSSIKDCLDLNLLLSPHLPEYTF